eukprot:3031993-Pleurochrysis_carterae.AAC.3
MTALSATGEAAPSKWAVAALATLRLVARAAAHLRLQSASLCCCTRRDARSAAAPGRLTPPTRSGVHAPRRRAPCARAEREPQPATPPPEGASGSEGRTRAQTRLCEILPSLQPSDGAQEALICHRYHAARQSLASPPLRHRRLAHAGSALLRAQARVPLLPSMSRNKHRPTVDSRLSIAG